MLLKKILFYLAAFLFIAVIAILFLLWRDTWNKYPAVDLSGVQIPEFKEVPTTFVHHYDDSQSQPVMASAIVDVDGDGKDEIFVGGGFDQPDVLFACEAGEFKDVSTAWLPAKPAGLSTFGAATVDADRDGDDDMFIAREGGVYYYQNEGGKFTAEKLGMTFNDQSDPVSFALADLNGDSLVDVFVCTYIKKAKMQGQTIFRDSTYGSTSQLFLNLGNNRFKDITRESGLEYIHNTFTAVFVDVDDDGLPDLVVAHDTGQARTWHNKGDLHFEYVPNPTSAYYAYPMGIGLGDYNNDSRPDFFFSNTGSSTPDFVVRGDLKPEQSFNPKWILFRNDGGFAFTDVAGETKTADYEFSWGALFHDFNLDGRQDLVVAENYAGWPGHWLFKLPCRFLLQLPDGTFAPVEDKAHCENRNYAFAPLSSDFNMDGYPDLAYANLGGPLKIFLSVKPASGGNNCLKVRLPNTPENLGAVVTVETPSGKKQTDYFVAGEGLCSDQSRALSFGLGAETSARLVRVRLPNGKILSVENVPSGTTVRWPDLK